MGWCRVDKAHLAAPSVYDDVRQALLAFLGMFTRAVTLMGIDLSLIYTSLARIQLHNLLPAKFITVVHSRPLSLSRSLVSKATRDKGWPEIGFIND